MAIDYIDRLERAEDLLSEETTDSYSAMTERRYRELKKKLYRILEGTDQPMNGYAGVAKIRVYYHARVKSRAKANNQVRQIVDLLNGIQDRKIKVTCAELIEEPEMIQQTMLDENLDAVAS